MKLNIKKNRNIDLCVGGRGKGSRPSTNTHIQTHTQTHTHIHTNTHTHIHTHKHTHTHTQTHTHIHTQTHTHSHTLTHTHTHTHEVYEIPISLLKCAYGYFSCRYRIREQLDAKKVTNSKLRN